MNGNQSRKRTKSFKGQQHTEEQSKQSSKKAKVKTIHCEGCKQTFTKYKNVQEFITKQMPHRHNIWNNFTEEVFDDHQEELKKHCDEFKPRR